MRKTLIDSLKVGNYYNFDIKTQTNGHWEGGIAQVVEINKIDIIDNRSKQYMIMVKPENDPTYFVISAKVDNNDVIFDLRLYYSDPSFYSGSKEQMISYGQDYIFNDVTNETYAEIIEYKSYGLTHYFKQSTRGPKYANIINCSLQENGVVIERNGQACFIEYACQDEDYLNHLLLIQSFDELDSNWTNFELLIGCDLNLNIKAVTHNAG
jgi:hypothetical protein